MSEFSIYSMLSLPIPVLYVIAFGLATLVAMRNKLSNASFFFRLGWDRTNSIGSCNHHWIRLQHGTRVVTVRVEVGGKCSLSSMNE